MEQQLGHAKLKQLYDLLDEVIALEVESASCEA
jgi:hypothetical protein